MNHREVLVHSERGIVLERGVAGITDGESTIDVYRHVMRQIRVDRNSDIGRTKILGAEFLIAEPVEGETKRVHHTRAEHIVMPNRNRIEYIVATRGGAGQRVLRNCVGQGNQLFHDRVAAKDVLLGAEFIIDARCSFVIVLAERDSRQNHSAGIQCLG